MSSRVLVVSNRASGKADEVLLERIGEELLPLGSVEHFEAGSPESFDAEMQDAGRDADLVAVAGGDGTINCVLNALADSLPDHTFAIVPMGTGNDFARTLGMPDDPVEAARAIAKGKDAEVNFGRVSGGGTARLFVNACMGGFPIEVDKAIEGDAKRRLGPFAFWLGGVKAATEFSTSTVNVMGSRIEQCVAVGVGNGRTAGGGIQVWPAADPADGLLEVCAIAAPSIAKALVIAARARSGDHVDHPEVHAYRGDGIRIEADPQIEFNVDGELVGVKSPAEFLVVGNIRVRTPA